MSKIHSTVDRQNQSVAGEWTDSLWFQILLIAALVLGTFFRLSGLGHKVYSHDEAFTSLYAAGYNAPEAYQLIWSESDHTSADLQKYLRPSEDKRIADTLSVMTVHEPQSAPIFFLLAHYWMRFIGYTPAAMRGLALVFGLLSIPAMYWFSREFFQVEWIALLATAFFALSPFQILFSQDARPYSLWTLAILLSSGALLRAIRTDSWTAWLLFSLTIIFGMYSHQLFALVTIVYGLYFVLTQPIRARKSYIEFLCAAVLALIAYAPWLSILINHWGQTAGIMDWVNIQPPWYRYIQKWLLIFAAPFLDLDFNLNSLNLIAYALRAFMMAFIAYTLYVLVRRSSQRQWIFILLIYIITAGALILPDLILGGMRSINGRFFVPVNIATILVVSYFVADQLKQKVFPVHGRAKLAICILMGASLLSNINSLLAESWWNKELGRVRLEFIREIDKDQTLLIETGYTPTNLGDLFVLSSALHSDVHFKLLGRADELKVPSGYQNVYWFPSSVQELQKISAQKGLRVSEVIEHVLWRIGGGQNTQ